MGSGLITQVVLPSALFFIMLGVGMSLKVADFHLLWRQPRIVLIGALMQLLLLPLLALVVITLFQLPPALAVGVLILALAPGGATSNMITYLCRGDTALSVCLTAISGLITPFTMPLLTVMAIGLWMGQQAAIDFPVIEAMAKLFVIAVLPAFIGALLRHKCPDFCQRTEKPIKIIACVFLLLVVTGIVKANWAKLPDLVMILGPAILTLVCVAMLSGYLMARKLRLSQDQGITLAIEVGIQNAATALMVTGGILHNAEMSASALIYGILMNIPAFILIAYRNLTTFQDDTAGRTY